MSHRSAPGLLALHGVRLLSYAGSREVASLFGLGVGVVDEHLLDAQAMGWVRRESFAGSTGWSLTDRGRARNQLVLAAEPDDAGAGPAVDAAHEQFRPLNTRLGDLMTQWQLRPTTSDPMAVHDHRDADYDDAVVARLGRLLDDVTPICCSLEAAWTGSPFIGDASPRAIARSGRCATSGWTAQASRRSTCAGSRCTRTSWPPWASTAEHPTPDRRRPERGPAARRTRAD